MLSDAARATDTFNKGAHEDDFLGQVKPIDGISLLPLIDGKMARRPKPIPFWKYPGGRDRKNEPYLDADALTGTWRTFRNYRHPQPQPDQLAGHATLIDNRYKLHRLTSGDYELYDVVSDPGETNDLADDRPGVVAKMKAALIAWQRSVEQSLARQDY